MSVAMLTHSVESDRTLLLDKARTAFDSRLDDKARRILQRLAARTLLDGAAAASNADGTAAAAASSSTAASSRDVFALPIVAPLPAALPAERPVGDGLQLPALAPAVHSALSAAAAPPPVSLPTADQPPLFLVYNNLGLLHLRAGKFVISNIFFARALEHADQLLSALDPPLPSAAAAVTPLSPSAPHARLHKFSSSPDSRLPSPTAAGATRPPPLITTPAAASRSLQSPRSPHSRHTASGSPTSSTAAPGGSQSQLPLHAFLLSKSFDVFYNTATALLQSHAPTAVQAAAGCATPTEWSASAACAALQLSVRCYRRCLQLSSSPPWSLLPPALAAASASKLMRAHLRAADGLILLHRCAREVTRRACPLPPLLQQPVEVTLLAADSTDSDSGSTTASAAAAASFSHLRQLLALLSDSAHTAAAATLKQAATLQLAYVLLNLRDAHGALQLLQPLLQDHQPPVAEFGSAARRLHAQLYAVEAHLQLQQSDAALGLLRQCDAPCAGRLLRAAGLLDSAAATTASGPVQSDGADEARLADLPDPSLALHLCATLAFILLAQQRSDAAQRCIRIGLDLQPAHTLLLRLRLLTHMQHDARMTALWLIKRRLPDSAPLFSVTTSP